MIQIGKLPKLSKQNKTGLCISEAKYYLGNNDFDYQKSLEEYKMDLKVEIEMYEQAKLAKKLDKKKCIIF